MTISLPKYKTGTIKSGDVDIFHRAFGRRGKTPILILHGLSYFSYDWIGVADVLSKDREVVAMDMRGFGNSSWSPAGAYKVQDFAGDIVALCDAFGWAKAILMGHSMGGRNCTYAATAHPDRVEKLVLVDYSPTNAKEGSQRVTNTIVDMPPAFASVDEAMRYFGVDPTAAGETLRNRFAAYLMPGDGGGLIVRRDPHFRENFRLARDQGVKPDHGADLWACLGQITCPILVLRGKTSDMFAAETVEKVRQANPRATVVELDGGHNLAGDNPEGLVKAVRSFIA